MAILKRFKVFSIVLIVLELVSGLKCMASDPAASFGPALLQELPTHPFRNDFQLMTFFHSQKHYRLEDGSLDDTSLSQNALGLQATLGLALGTLRWTQTLNPKEYSVVGGHFFHLKIHSALSLIPQIELGHQNHPFLRLGNKAVYEAADLFSGKLSMVLHPWIKLETEKHGLGFNSELQWQDSLNGSELRAGVIAFKSDSFASTLIHLSLQTPLTSQTSATLEGFQSIAQSNAYEQQALALGFQIQLDSPSLPPRPSSDLKNAKLSVISYQERRFWIKVATPDAFSPSMGQKFDVYRSAESDLPIARATVFESRANEAILSIDEFFIPDTIQEGFEARPVVR